MSLSNLNSHMERIVTLINAEEKKFLNPLDLQPFHLNVLNYLSVCNKYSNTPVAVSKYFGNTKGTTSQTINLLEKKGYIEKQKSTDDKRSVKLKLTNRGASLTELIKSKIDRLCNDVNLIRETDTNLLEILRSIQKSNSFKTFGVCKSCKYFITEEEGYRCGLTKERLFKNEIEKICFEHEYEAA